MKNNETYHRLMVKVYLLLEKFCKFCWWTYMKLADFFANKKGDYARANKMLDYAGEMRVIKARFSSKELDHEYWVRPY